MHDCSSVSHGLAMSSLSIICNLVPYLWTPRPPLQSSIGLPTFSPPAFQLSDWPTCVLTRQGRSCCCPIFPPILGYPGLIFSVPLWLWGLESDTSKSWSLSSYLLNVTHTQTHNLQNVIPQEVYKTTGLERPQEVIWIVLQPLFTHSFTRSFTHPLFIHSFLH